MCLIDNNPAPWLRCHTPLRSPSSAARSLIIELIIALTKCLESRTSLTLRQRGLSNILSAKFLDSFPCLGRYQVLLSESHNHEQIAEFAAVTVSPVTAVMVMSPVAKSSPVRSPVKEWSPVKHF